MRNCLQASEYTLLQVRVDDETQPTAPDNATHASKPSSAAGRATPLTSDCMAHLFAQAHFQPWQQIEPTNKKSVFINTFRFHRFSLTKASVREERPVNHLAHCAVRHAHLVKE